MQAIGFILFLALGLVQLFAVMDGLEHWVGLHWLLAAPLSLFLAYIPLIGTIVGMAGAITVWNWEWWEAGLLFFGGFLLVLVIAAISGAVGSLRKD